MNNNLMLRTASMLSVLLFIFHVADDIVRGIEPGTTQNLPALLIFTVWSYGTLVLGERRSGHVIMLLGALLATVVPVLHMDGRGVGIASNIGKSGNSFFFVWTLLAIGTTGLFSLVLAVRGLWRLRKTC